MHSPSSGSRRSGGSLEPRIEMTSAPTPSLWPLHCVLVVILLAGCPGTDPDPDPTPESLPAPSLSIEGVYGLHVGESVALAATTIHGADASYAWQSADATLVEVDGSGVVTAIAVGETVITVTGIDTGASATHPIVVMPEPVSWDAFLHVSGAFYVGVGDSIALTAVTINAEDSGYLWSLDDGSVATIDEEGVITGLAGGAVTVTAEGLDTGLVGTLGVYVAWEIPHWADWSSSPHADRDAEAFSHWDAAGEIPAGCARCHSAAGFRDYLGDDGSPAFVVDQAALIGSTVECVACHNPASAVLDTVIFPSGEQIEGLGVEARCMTCHQGLASKDTVDEEILAAGSPADDEQSAALSFVNIHFYAAGATLNGARARGGYEYDGQTYDVRFRHVPDRDTCVGCHDPHTTALRVEVCSTCHEGVLTPDDVHEVRMFASATSDYDGDGNVVEGLWHELQGLRAALIEVLSAYARAQGDPICFHETAYPYYFLDTDDDGVCATAEAVEANRYLAWTPRLLRAAYNLQVATRDPGAFAHNGKYVIELLHDSIEDLNTAMGSPFATGQLDRTDVGHWNGASEAARGWDQEEAISASCSKCHGGSEGLQFFLEHGVGGTVLETANGLDCATCHETFADPVDPADRWRLVDVDSVVLPGGVEMVDPDQPSNLCATCHSGRESKASVDAAIAAGAPAFKNIHQLPAAAVKAGATGHVGYEYTGKTYAPERFYHPGGEDCLDCHDPLVSEHTFRVAPNLPYCITCHYFITELADIRPFTLDEDYDGDGDALEPLAAELDGLSARVIEAMQTHAPLCFVPDSYPYYWNDLDGDGVCDPSEQTTANRFVAWTAPLSKAAFNVQMQQNDPGAWAHNFSYMAELLVDSIDDLGGPTTGLIRP